MSGKALFGSNFARSFSRAWLLAGYLFLYLPIVALVIYSPRCPATAR
jgi:putrescine transport system permease protein